MDTIAAIATALSNHGIAIVKLSGDDSIEIVNKIFKGPDLTKRSSHTISYGYIVNDRGENIDEVLVSVFRKPKSYTCEDVVEINTHGGNLITKEVLSECLKHGARLAEPGEFTKRAFINGRIDLTEAEAIMDTITSESQKSLKLSRKGLFKETKNEIDKLRERLLEVILKAEVNIDYPEYEDEEKVTSGLIKTEVTELLKKFKNIILYSKDKQLYQKGINAGIVGKPNAGKSSLLNALLGYQKAIVTSEAGTTRDLVEAEIVVEGLPLHFIDTAGLRTGESEAEKIGVTKAQKVIEEADLLFLVFDSSIALTESDLSLLKETHNKKRIVIVNKSDLPLKIDRKAVGEHLYISTFKQKDILNIKKKIIELFNLNDIDTSDETYLGTTRQVTCLERASKFLEDTLEGTENHVPLDLLLIDLKGALLELDMILGYETEETVVSEMFKRFCLGK